MLVYEGGDSTVEVQTGTTKKGTYLAAGSKEYDCAVQEYVENFERDDSESPLQHCPPAPAAATPPGHNSIARATFVEQCVVLFRLFLVRARTLVTITLSVE